MHLIFISVALTVTLAGAVYGISLYFFGRYIAKTHPSLWKQLRSPSLTTAQGPRRDRLSEWIGKERYLKMTDEHLVRHGRTLRKLQRTSFVIFIGGFVILGLGLIGDLILKH